MAHGKHKWTFSARFQTGAYGLKGSRLACRRLREATSEIKKVAKKDPVLGAEGAVRLMEKIWPALQQVDTSSGALGTAVNKALDALIPIIIQASADGKVRCQWLESPGTGRIHWFPRSAPAGRIPSRVAISTALRRACPVY